MKTVWIVLGSVALAVVLIAAGLWIGSAWAQGGSGGNRIGYGPMGSGMIVAILGDNKKLRLKKVSYAMQD